MAPVIGLQKLDPGPLEIYNSQPTSQNLPTTHSKHLKSKLQTLNVESWYIMVHPDIGMGWFQI